MSTNSPHWILATSLDGTTGNPSSTMKGGGTIVPRGCRGWWLLFLCHYSDVAYWACGPCPQWCTCKVRLGVVDVTCHKHYTLLLLYASQSHVVLSQPLVTV